MGQTTSCPNCDQPLSFSHQCQDHDQQTNIDNFHLKNGHSEETEKDKIFKYEREYLAIHPDLPEDYKRKREDFLPIPPTATPKVHICTLCGTGKPLKTG